MRNEMGCGVRNEMRNGRWVVRWDRRGDGKWIVALAKSGAFYRNAIYQKDMAQNHAYRWSMTKIYSWGLYKVWPPPPYQLKHSGGFLKKCLLSSHLASVVSKPKKIEWCGFHHCFTILLLQQNRTKLNNKKPRNWLKHGRINFTKNATFKGCYKIVQGQGRLNPRSLEVIGSLMKVTRKSVEMAKRLLSVSRRPLRVTSRPQNVTRRPQNENKLCELILEHF